MTASSMNVSLINLHNMDIQEIKTRINEFKAIKSKGSITPESLGTLLDDMLEAITAHTPTVLDVNLADSKTKFIRNENFTAVWNAMQSNEGVHVAVRVNYSSGLKVMYYATCVKQSYISLHAKAGSCELHLNADASFTISGTSLW